MEAGKKRSRRRERKRSTKKIKDGRRFHDKRKVVEKSVKIPLERKIKRIKIKE